MSPIGEINIEEIRAKLSNAGPIATAALYNNANDLGAALDTTPSGPAGGDLTGSYPNPTLAAVGTAGTYTKVTTDSKGRVTSGTNPTTLSGYGITDGVTTTDPRLTDARTPTGSAGGDLTGTYPNPTLGTVGTAGTYRSVTTDSKGRVTSGTNPTTLSGYGITDAVSSTATQSANTVFAGPSTGPLPSAPSFRALITDDIPLLPYSKLNLTNSITNADIASLAGIADTKLATISSASKVSNSATTATNLNTANAIVARNASGNFSAGTITANLTGTASTATNLAGGSGGSIPYQTAAGATTMLSNGSAGQVLTSNGGTSAPSWASAAVGGATICTSTTRPASPSSGRLIYETDTLNFLVWTGSAWARINKVRKAVTFNSSGSWTPPAGVTYAIAEMAGGGGGGGGNGNGSSVFFTSGTVTAVGGVIAAQTGGLTLGGSSNGTANSASGSTFWGYTVPGTYGSTLRFASTVGMPSVVRSAGGTCTPGTPVTVSVGAGGASGTPNPANGGSGWVTIYYEE